MKGKSQACQGTQEVPIYPHYLIHTSGAAQVIQILSWSMIS